MKYKYLLVIASIFVLFHNLYANESKLPSQILNLDHWKLTIPYSLKKGQKKASEISQPELNHYQHPIAFLANKESDGVIFRAHCTDSTTKNSSYPRSELREMSIKNETYQKASWSTTDKTKHIMTLTQAITSTPKVKKHVVSAQIHDEEDDLLMIRLENKKLFIERNKLNEILLTDNYQLGEKFNLKIEAFDGHVKVYFNDLLKMDWKISRSNCYFKTGFYTQSNSKKGDSPSSYGEVILYHLDITHE